MICRHKQWRANSAIKPHTVLWSPLWNLCYVVHHSIHGVEGWYFLSLPPFIRSFIHFYSVFLDFFCTRCIHSVITHSFYYKAVSNFKRFFDSVTEWIETWKHMERKQQQHKHTPFKLKSLLRSMCAYACVLTNYKIVRHTLVSLFNDQLKCMHLRWMCADLDVVVGYGVKG